MAIQGVQTNCGLLVHDLDLSADATVGFNAVGLAVGAEAVEANRYVTSGANAKRMEPGLATAAVEAQGYFNSVEDDKLLGSLTIATHGQRGCALTIMPIGRAVNDPAFMLRTVSGQYSPFGGGELGAMLQWRLQAAARVMAGTAPTAWPGAAVKGVLALITAAAGSTVGTALNLGAVSATQRIWCSAHVLSTGGDVTALVQSDSGSGFPSPTTQISVPAINPSGSATLSAPGAIADTWWRVNLTVASGVATTFFFLGIQ